MLLWCSLSGFLYSILFPVSASLPVHTYLWLWLFFYTLSFLLSFCLFSMNLRLSIWTVVTSGLTATGYARSPFIGNCQVICLSWTPTQSFSFLVCTRSRLVVEAAAVMVSSRRSTFPVLLIIYLFLPTPLVVSRSLVSGSKQTEFRSELSASTSLEVRLLNLGFADLFHTIEPSFLLLGNFNISHLCHYPPFPL